MSTHHDLIVLGAGSGGLAPAQRAASSGARCAIIERATTVSEYDVIAEHTDRKRWLLLTFRDLPVLCAEFLDHAIQPDTIDLRRERAAIRS